MPTVLHGDFEWDADKASENVDKHGVAFEEAALAMRDALAIDFDDLVEPQKHSHVGGVACGGYPVHCQHRARRPHQDHQRPERNES